MIWIPWTFSGLKSISSTANPYIKDLLGLQAKAKERKRLGKFVVEGLNEIRLGSLNHFKWETVLFNPEIISQAELIQECSINENTEFIEVNSKVFEKIAYRGEVKNAVAVGFSKTAKLESVKFPKSAIVLVAEGIEKPGNLGAILRSADALKADAVILADSKVDLYNPNAIRGSVGTVFTVPVFESDSLSCIDFLKKEGFEVYTTFMDNAQASWDVEISKRAAIIVGTEHSGLTDVWKKSEFSNINVPMFGQVDSLNVSVAVSLLLYEFRKQQQHINTTP